MKQQNYPSHATVAIHLPSCGRDIVEAAAARTGSRSLSSYAAEKLHRAAIEDLMEDEDGGEPRPDRAA